MLDLLLVFAHQLSQEIWKARTAKKPLYIKVHDIKMPNEILNGQLAFQAIIGCDTASQCTGIYILKNDHIDQVFQQCPILHNLGQDEVLDKYQAQLLYPWQKSLYAQNL